MAIVQISQITNRKGLQIDLPSPLAGAELGWSTDTRQLYIGNGTLAEGAPVVGNTEILTEFSDIIEKSKYIYSGLSATGYVAQTGATPATPVIVQQQAWMDQYASVLDFGAVGDGVTDNTAAINRALFQLYCREPGEIATRRSLFFPAGIYRVTGVINIPSSAGLYGEGPQNTIILSDSSSPYAAQYTDFNQAPGSSNPISNIRIADMQFQHTDPDSNVFLVQSATGCEFTNTAFVGGRVQADLTTAANPTVAVGFDNSAQNSADIIFTGCLFAGTTYALETALAIRSITIDKSQFNTLFSGVVLLNAAAAAPTGVRITSCTFDNIYSSGITIGGNLGAVEPTLNASAHNTFYNVGNSFGSAPTSIIIGLYAHNNISIGDMFSRSAADSLIYERILVDGQDVIATTGGEKIEMGTFTRRSGLASTVPGSFSVDVTGIGSIAINYAIESLTGIERNGVFTVARTAGTPVTSDDYTEGNPTGITLVATQTGNVITVTATSSLGIGGAIYYSVNYLN